MKPHRNSTFLAIAALASLSAQAAEPAPPAYGAPGYATPGTVGTPPPPPAGVSSVPVTQEQFKQVLKILKRVVDRFDELEKKVNKIPAGAGAGKSEEAVDLSDLDKAPTPGAAPVGMPSGNTTHSASAGAPGFKVYFDLNLVNRPGITGLTFQNFHSLLLFEMLPDNKLQFSFDVNPTPRYYELAYQMTPKLQLRAGKIWIPFDDMAPHNIFGGRVNVSRLAQPNSSTGVFLPDLWTDLGVGFKLSAVDKPKFTLDFHGYVVNGFGSGGTDPTGSGATYPSFSDSSIASADNNRDKAIGGRVHARLFKFFGLGASYYMGRWNDDSEAESRRLSILGLDSQFRFTSTELRLGLASMSVSQTPENFSRGGFYGEIGQRFGPDRRWKLLLRGGTIQHDNRVIDVTDQQLVGATLIYQPGLIEYSIEHSRDLKEVSAKVNTQYTNLRMVIAL